MTTIENPDPQRRRHRDPLRHARRVKGNPEIAKFQFRATNRWVSGTHNQSTIHGFYGAMQEMAHQQPCTFDADHPAVLVGARQRPDARSSSCCTPSPPASPPAWPTSPPPAASTSTEVESTVEGDIDLLGILGLSDEVRNGYQQIKVSFKLRGDDPEKLRQVVEQSRRRSAVYDVVTNGVPVAIEVDAG